MHEASPGEDVGEMAYRAPPSYASARWKLQWGAKTLAL